MDVRKTKRRGFSLPAEVGYDGQRAWTLRDPKVDVPHQENPGRMLCGRTACFERFRRFHRDIFHGPIEASRGAPQSLA